MIAVLADSHLGTLGDDLEAFEAAVAAIRRSGASGLYLLGDIFRYLVADPKFASPLLDRFLALIRGLRTAGIAITYVEGNRDFFLEGSALATEFDAVGLEATFDAGPRRFLLVHGDGINERDWPYRFWRLTSKSRVSYAAMKLIPKQLANSIVASMERRLRDTNFKHKSRLPEEMIERYSRRRHAQGYTDVLLGHFHESWSRQLASGRVTIVPPFLEERRWVEIDEAGAIRLASLA